MKHSQVLALMVILVLSLLPRPARAAEESADGLKSTITAIVEAAKADQKDEVQRLSQRLVLSDPAKYFSEVFGEEKGKKLADEYAKLPKDDIATLFLQCAKSGRMEVLVIKIEKADDPNATGLQKAAINAMTKPVALYTVKLVKPGQKTGMSVWSFVFTDGSFRLAGKMRAVK